MIILAQVVLFKGLVLFGVGFCFIYLIVFLLLPKDVSPILQLLLGFTTGLIIDTFYNSPGIHALVSTFMMYLRPYWITVLTPSGGYDIGTKMNVKAQGVQWFTSYALPLIFAHYLILFFVEASGFRLFWLTLSKAFYSSLFTFIVVIIVQYLFTKRSRY